MADIFDNFDFGNFYDNPNDDPFGYFQSDAYWLNNPYEFKKEFTENETNFILKSLEIEESIEEMENEINKINNLVNNSSKNPKVKKKRKISKKKQPKPTFLDENQMLNKKKIYTCDRCGRNDFINGHALGGHKKYCMKTLYYKI
tara:strand:- start:680 stop:1111 length:432 start_codon:yes stop_codon:yes gene_type:complete